MRQQLSFYVNVYENTLPGHFKCNKNKNDKVKYSGTKVFL